MSRICCFSCHDGQHGHCDGCNLYEISVNLWKILKEEKFKEEINWMSDKEFYEYLSGNPTITGIIRVMKEWWSNEGTDKIIQDAFDKILEIEAERESKSC